MLPRRSHHAPKRRLLFLTFVLLLAFSNILPILAQEATPPVELPSETPVPTLEVPTLPPTEPPPPPTDVPPPTATPTTLPAATDNPTAPGETTEPASATVTEAFMGLPTETATLFPPEPPLTLLYSDNFESGDMSAWTFGSGWALEMLDSGQALRVFNSNEPTAFIQRVDLFNVVAEARFDLAAADAAQITLRQSAAGAYTAVLDTYDQLSLYRAGQLLQTIALPPAADSWRALRLSAMANVIRIAVDGVSFIVYQDDAPLPAGMVAFGGIFADVTPAARPPLNTLRVDDVFIWVPVVEYAPATATQPALIAPVWTEEGVAPVTPEVLDLETSRSEVSIASFAPGQGTGLYGEYYDNLDFTDLVFTRVDSKIDFDWSTGTPNPALNGETFSIRWTGFVEPLYSETYTFYTRSDDGVRLWVNEQLLIDQWNLHSVTEHSGTISLNAGQQYSIRLEYYENTVYAVIQLFWSSPSQSKQIIPPSQLYVTASTPTPTPTVTPTVTPLPTVTPYPVPMSLNDYNVYVINDLGQSLPAQEQAVFDAVRKTGEALLRHSSLYPDLDLYGERTFRRVMGGDASYLTSDGNDPLIGIVFYQRPQVNCETINLDDIPTTGVLSAAVFQAIVNAGYSQRLHQAVIGCHTNVNLSEFTVVHELGHVFDGLVSAHTFTDEVVTTGTNPILDTGVICEPTIPNCTEAIDRLKLVVMGNVWNSQTNQPYWLRGDRGWGSDNPDSGSQLTDFQQHYLPPPPYPQALWTEAYAETAADMFLNWVYRHSYSGPIPDHPTAPGTWRGFLNMSWADNDFRWGNCSTGCPDISYPGDARYRWTNNFVARLVSTNGW